MSQQYAEPAGREKSARVPPSALASVVTPPPPRHRAANPRPYNTRYESHHKLVTNYERTRRKNRAAHTIFHLFVRRRREKRCAFAQPLRRRCKLRDTARRRLGHLTMATTSANVRTVVRGRTWRKLPQAVVCRGVIGRIIGQMFSKSYTVRQRVRFNSNGEFWPNVGKRRNCGEVGTTCGRWS